MGRPTKFWAGPACLACPLAPPLINVNNTVAKCVRSINILRIISHPSKGWNRKLLLQLYRCLIRSRLDYGAPIYNLASKSVLSLLVNIQTSSLRLALGAYRTSPDSVYVPKPLNPPFLPPTGANLQLTYFQLNFSPSPLTLPGFA